MIHQDPLVSIIIPTFNRAHLIGETLDSVLGQTYQNWECIVVDDGSTDNTDLLIADYMAKDGRFQYHHRPKDRLPGGNAARNYGFEVSKGEYIQWFDSDDIMYINYLESRVELFKDLKIVSVFCAYQYFDITGIQNRISNSIFTGDLLEDFLKGSISFSPLSFIVRRTEIENIKFDENIQRAQDLDFFFRLFTNKSDFRFAHIGDPLFKVRKHSEAISGNNIGGLYSRFIVNERILDYFYSINHKKGIQIYQNKFFKHLRRLLENGEYKIVFWKLYGFKKISFIDRVKLYNMLIIYFMTKRGAKKFQRMGSNLNY